MNAKDMRAISEQAKTDAIEKFFNSEYTVYFEDIMNSIIIILTVGSNFYLILFKY